MFLKYLMDKKLITSDQALSVTIEYLEGRPSLLKTIQAEGILDTDRIMEIYFQAGQKGKSFFDAFAAESGLTATDLTHLYKVQHRSGKGLTQIIVEKGFLAQDKLESALREYINLNPAVKDNSDGSNHDEVQSAEPKIKGEPAPEATPAGISAAALESLKEVSGLDSSQLSELEGQVVDQDTIENSEEVSDLEDDNSIYREEYFNLHNEELQSELLVVANRYRLKKREKDLSLFRQNLIKILSLAKLSQFNFIEKLLTPYETLMSNILDGQQDDPGDWSLPVMDMLDLLWRFRTLLFEGQLESAIMSNTDFEKKYIENIKAIISYIKREK